MSSIFDLSGQTPKKRPPRQNPSPLSQGSSEEDPVETLRKIREMNAKLTDEILNMEVKMGVDPKEVKEAMEGIRRASPLSYRKLNEGKTQLEMKILGLSDRELSRQKSVEIGKERKGKTLGARRRWLDMR